MSEKEKNNNRAVFYSGWGQEEETQHYHPTNQIKLLSLLMNFNRKDEQYNQDISNTQRSVGKSLEYNNQPNSLKSLYNNSIRERNIANSSMNASSKQQSSCKRTKSTFSTQFPSNLITQSQKNKSLNQLPLSKAQVYDSFTNTHDRSPSLLEFDQDVTSKKITQKQLAGFRFKKKLLKPIETTRLRFKTPSIINEIATPYIELSKNTVVLLNLLKKKTIEQPIVKNYRLTKDEFYKSYSKSKQFIGTCSTISYRNKNQK